MPNLNIKGGKAKVVTSSNTHVYTTPMPPVLTASDSNDTLSASQTTYPNDILVSTNGGSYVAYTGTINVGNVARAAGYWKFKIKADAGTYRNESPIANSPLFTVNPTVTTTYYISNSGSTSNTGTDTTHPWPISKLFAGNTYPDGTSFLFNKGEIFVGTVKPTVNNNVVYDAYGTGANPILTTMGIFPNSTIAGNWVQQVGLTNVWTLIINPLVSYTPRVWLDEIEYQRAKLKGDITATKRTCWENSDKEYLHVYSIGNPTTYYTSIKTASFSTSTLDVSGQNTCVVRNLDIRGSQGSSMDAGFSTNLTVELCSIGKDGNRGGLRINTINGLIVRNNTFDTGERIKQDFNLSNEGGDGVTVGQGDTQNVEIYNNIFKNWRHNGTLIEGDNTNNLLSNVHLHHNEVTAPDIEYGRAISCYFYHSNNVVVEYNNFHDLPVQSQFAGKGLIFQNNTIDGISNNPYYEMGTGLGMFIGHSYFPATNMQILNNIIKNCYTGGIEMNGSLANDGSYSNIQSNIIQGNTFSNNGWQVKNPSYDPTFFPLNCDIIIRDNVNVLNNSYINNTFTRQSTDRCIYYGHDISKSYLKTIDQFNALNGTANDVITGNIAGLSSSSILTGSGTSYNLTTSAKTSGGIFKKDGTLVRTLWSGVQQSAGTYNIVWDGTDDFKNTLLVQDYDIKVIANNIVYLWEGFLGNTSTAITDKNKRHRSLDPITSIEIVGNTAYYSVGYNEGNGSMFPFSLSTPQEKMNPWQALGIQYTSKSCTDGTYVYWDVVPAYQQGLSAVFATKVSDNSIVNFPNGTSFSVQYGNTYSGAVSSLNSFRQQTFTYNGGAKSFTINETIPYHLNTVTTPAKGEQGYDPFNQNDISKSGFTVTLGTNLNIGDQVTIKWWRLETVSALAVNSTYLFIARYNTPFIEVLNKTTGASVRTISSFTDISAMTVDISTNNLWVASSKNVVTKYPINNDGTLANATVTINGGLSEVINMKIGNGMLLLVDAGTNQQIKSYSLTSGALNWTLGQQGGNLVNPTVTNDRFAFLIIDEYEGKKVKRGGCAIAPDGSFWVADSGNRRMLHFDANRNYIEQVMFQGKTYSTYVDPNNHSRVLTNFQEFQVVYNQANIKDAWLYKYNWETSFDATKYISGVKIRCITTLSNNKTYAFLYRYNGGEEVVELNPNTGIRPTGSLHTLPGQWMDKSGNIYSLEDGGVGGTAIIKKDTLTGFDINGNPIYSGPVAVFTNSTQTGMMYPRLSGAHIRTWEVSSSNILAQFRGNGNDSGTENNVYHFGGIDLTTGQFKFMTSPATFLNYHGMFPSDGAFDIGNGPPQYYGNVAVALDRHFIWGYNGEFWKASQTNKWNHYYDNGLFLGQFGKTGPEFNIDPITNKEFSGNAFCPSIVKEGNDFYMYHNDESVYGAFIRWKITGLDTVKELVLPITSSYSRVADTPVLGSIMEGLPWDVVLPASVAGWSRFPTTDNLGKWEVKSAYAEYRKYRKPADIYIKFNNVNQNVASQSYVNRTLGTNSGLTNWTLAGIINYYDSFPNINEENLYLQILDNSGKVIARFQRRANFSTNANINDYYCNNNLSFTLQGNSKYTSYEQPLVISKASGNNISFQFADQSIVTVPIYDSTANIGNPTILQVMFDFVVGNVNGFGKEIDLKGFTFNTTLL